jgi:hypothetical protein
MSQSMMMKLWCWIDKCLMMFVSINLSYTRVTVSSILAYVGANPAVQVI